MPMLSVVKSLVLFVSSYRPFWIFVEVTVKYSFPDFPSTIPDPRSLPVPRFSKHPMFEIMSLFRFIQNTSRKSIWWRSRLKPSLSRWQKHGFEKTAKLAFFQNA